MSYRAISHSLRAGVLIISPSTFFANTVLPAPINVTFIFNSPFGDYEIILSDFLSRGKGFYIFYIKEWQFCGEYAKILSYFNCEF